MPVGRWKPSCVCWHSEGCPLDRWVNARAGRDWKGSGKDGNMSRVDGLGLGDCTLSRLLDLINLHRSTQTSDCDIARGFPSLNIINIVFASVNNSEGSRWTHFVSLDLRKSSRGFDSLHSFGYFLRTRWVPSLAQWRSIRYILSKICGHRIHRYWGLTCILVLTSWPSGKVFNIMFLNNAVPNNK